MNKKIEFLIITIFFTFLALIFTNILLGGLIDFGATLILLLIYILSYAFIYKLGNFQKVLFILSICSFLFFISFFGYWFYYSYIPLLIILNWYIIWLIFKNGRINDKLVREKSFVFLAFIFYLLFNLILVFTDGEFLVINYIESMGPYISEIIGNGSLSMSIIFSIIFVVTMIYKEYSHLPYDKIDRNEK